MSPFRLADRDAARQDAPAAGTPHGSLGIGDAVEIVSIGHKSVAPRRRTAAVAFTIER